MGGRGGSSGLSGGGVGKLPELQGSEKQVAWANDIRGSTNRIAKMEDYVINHEKYEKAEKEARASGKSVEYIREFIQENNQAKIAREQMEYRVNTAAGQRGNSYTGELSKTEKARDSFLNKSYEKYRKGTAEYKEGRKKAVKEREEKYRKWLVKEHRTVLQTQRQASWWIDHR